MSWLQVRILPGPPFDLLREMEPEIFVLLPGAWHGSWCWNKIAMRLERAGHRVLTPDLPGNSGDGIAPAAVTLDVWTQCVCEILQAESESVFLVGASRAGIVISQVAERLPSKVKRLVYVSGFLLRDGESVLRTLREDGSSPLLRHATLSQDRSCWVLDERHRSEMFYGSCGKDDIEYARTHLSREPAAPLMTPIKITEENFGRVPRAYIHCLRDRAVPIELQKKMVAALPCGPVWAIDTDHSPFFSAPAELTARLLNLVQS